MKHVSLLLIVLVFSLTGTTQITPVKLSVYGYDFIQKVNDKLLFFATDESEPNNYELWSSDGTEGGTNQVMDIDGSTDGSILSPSYWGPGYTDRMWTVYNDYLYFIAYDPTHGLEIWKTDGTAGNTSLLKDIHPGGIGFADPYVYFPYFTEMDGLLYFAANDGDHGWELWVTDGSEVGTHMVIDISTDDIYGSNPEHLIVFNGLLYFTARDDVYGYEIYVSDGTDVGTQLLKDIVPGIYGSMNDGFAGSIDPQFTVAGNYLYFVGRSDSNGQVILNVFRTDGTEDGTFMIKDGLDYLSNFTDVNGQCYFYGYDGDYTHTGLYISDGSVDGTNLLQTDNDLAFSNEAHSFHVFNNELYAYGFKTNLTQVGLVECDGTGPGTNLIETYEGVGSIPTIFNFNEDPGSGTFFFHVIKKITDISMDIRMGESNGTDTHFYPGARPFRSTAFMDGDLYFLGIDTTAAEQYGLFKLHPTTIPSSTEDLPSQNMHVNVYPNPVHSVLHIHVPNWEPGMVFSIYDTKGAAIYSSTLKKETDLNVESWSAGNYSIGIETSHGIYTSEFIIEPN